MQGGIHSVLVTRGGPGRSFCCSCPSVSCFEYLSTFFPCICLFLGFVSLCHWVKFRFCSMSLLLSILNGSNPSVRLGKSVEVCGILRVFWITINGRKKCKSPAMLQICSLTSVRIEFKAFDTIYTMYFVKYITAFKSISRKSRCLCPKKISVSSWPDRNQ